MAEKGIAADKSLRYMPRYQVTTVALAPSGQTLEEVGRRLARALLSADSLMLERAADRYVVRTGSPATVDAELPLSLTEPLDNEYRARAKWAVVRLFPREHGRIKMLIKRVEPRHGFLSTYQNDGCRCAECTAANTEAALAYRRRTSPPQEKTPRKHGAHCWKYGCYCEERKAADRLRQARHRAKVAAAKSAAPGDFLVTAAVAIDEPRLDDLISGEGSRNEVPSDAATFVEAAMVTSEPLSVHAASEQVEQGDAIDADRGEANAGSSTTSDPSQQGTPVVLQPRLWDEDPTL